MEYIWLLRAGALVTLAIAVNCIKMIWHAVAERKQRNHRNLLEGLLSRWFQVCRK